MARLEDVVGYGTHSARPVAGRTGALYYETDTDTLFRDNGSTWDAFSFVGASPLTTKGDVYVFDTADARLAVGSDGDVLTADSTESLGVKWAAPSGGAAPAGELGYASGTTQRTTASTSSVDVSGLSLTFTVGTRPIKLTAWCDYVTHSVAGARAEVSIYDVTGAAQLVRAITTNAGTNGNFVCVIARVAPSAGSRTYKVQYRSFDAGTTTFGSNSSTAPYFLLAEEI